MVLQSTPQQGTVAPQASIPKEIGALLNTYADVFQEPSSLLPKRVVDHTIPLLNNSKPVNQRPYRLPHYQKAILEDLITQLLQAHMIKPSMSPYSSPVILVRKKDGT